MWLANGLSVPASWCGQIHKYIDGCMFFQVHQVFYLDMQRLREQGLGTKLKKATHK